MRELLRRLFAKPLLALELIAATFFVNVLALASMIFVIQVLNRYVTYGFDGTLITLTSGTVAAVLLAAGFRVVRVRLAQAISAGPDLAMARQVLGVLAGAKTQALGSVSRQKILDVTAAVQTVQSAHDASVVQNVVDLPFFLLFIGTIFLIDPLLAIVTSVFLGFALVFGLVGALRGSSHGRKLQDVSLAHRGLVNNAVNGPDTIRVFRLGSWLGGKWSEQLETMMSLRARLAMNRAVNQSGLATVSELLRVGVYAVGAVQAVRGDVSVGALIGVSFLASKAFAQVTGFIQSLSIINQASRAMSEIREFSRLQQEDQAGSGLAAYDGRIELKDVSFIFPGGKAPLFESLSLTLGAGTLMVVQGSNGAGKTTLARLLTGLLEPVRGQYLAGGVDVRQLAPHWWRGHIVYMPQEPTFLSATIRDNIVAANPDLGEGGLNAVVRGSGLRKYLDSTPQGLDTELTDGGVTLALGVRKRLALARALATSGIALDSSSPQGVDGRLVILDEPTEGLDKDGTQAVYTVINELLRRKATVVVVSHDPTIARGASVILDLDSKPTPLVRITKRQEPESAPAKGSVQ